MILDFKKKQNNSIYSIMKKCTSNGKLDVEKFDELMNPIEDSGVKFNPGLLEQFGINQDKRKEQVPQLLQIIEDIYNNKIEFNDLEDKLIEVDFKTLNVIDELRSHINNDNYNIETYETFKKLMYCTANKEVFKLSVEMTALIGKCEELLEDYILIGQYEEFSKYTSFILCMWSEKPKFLNALFDLLDESKDWGAIDYGEMLMRDKEIMADIKNQRRILIGTLSKNCIPMEVAFELASELNIEALAKIAFNDEELSEGLNDLYTTLLFEREPSGGILDLDNSIDYLNIYLDYLNKCEFQDVRFIGLKNIIEFLNDDENKDEIINEYNINVYEQVMVEAERLWNNIDLVDELRKIIKKGDKYIWDVVDFIKDKKIFELIPDLEKLYFSGNDCWALESLLCEAGSDNLKCFIYEKLKEQCKCRKQQEMSYSNLFGEEFNKKEKIIHKMDILFWEKAYDCELLDKLIEDYNPEIRSKALEILNKDSYYIENINIEKKVKDRLSDSPLYVRKNALEVCKKYDFKITSEEKDYILSKILEREGQKKYSSDMEFENNLNEIMN